jgi:Lipocalin-like domain
MWINRFAFVALFFFGHTAIAADKAALPITGTWVMQAAYEILVDGTRTTNYGEHPKGLMIVDPNGRYSLQIFRPDRPKFVLGVKAQGTPEEFRAASLGSSTHFGRIVVDQTERNLTFMIEASSYPNWEGTEQVREFSFANDTLTYAVPASASGNGTIAYSVWSRQQ